MQDNSRINIKAENGPKYPPGDIPSTVSRLHIHTTRPEDRGIYQCIGKNPAVDILSEHQLRQIWPPYKIENELVVFCKYTF